MPMQPLTLKPCCSNRRLWAPDGRLARPPLNRQKYPRVQPPAGNGVRTFRQQSVPVRGAVSPARQLRPPTQNPELSAPLNRQKYPRVHPPTGNGVGMFRRNVRGQSPRDILGPDPRPGTLCPLESLKVSKGATPCGERGKDVSTERPRPGGSLPGKATAEAPDPKPRTLCPLESSKVSKGAPPYGERGTGRFAETSGGSLPATSWAPIQDRNSLPP
jgi:hypothetical protein